VVNAAENHRWMDDVTLIRALKALAHPKRFRMVQEIAAAGELSCGAVGGCVELGQPTTSHHLKILTDAGILVVRREAQHGLVTLNREVLDEVVGLLPARLSTKPRRSTGRKPAKARRR
jgi:DNA-binding transcriptional ArsR family regulator